MFLSAPVSDYVTSKENLITIHPEETASQAIAAMKKAGVRHLVIAEGNVISGVINMQDVMSVVQRDERLSLVSLAKKYPGITSPVAQMREELKDSANALANDPETAKKDIIRVGTAILSAITVAGFFSQSQWLHEHADIAMIAIFVVGYIGIIFEEVFEFNKAAVALLMSTGMWVTYADYFQNPNGVATENVIDQLEKKSRF